jgi:AcrR family transcriptional regulator
MEQKYEGAAKRGRGRPRKYDFELALHQATDLFWTKGYAATSLDGIAAATGMNRPSLQAAFGDKREIYLAALGAYWASKIDTIRAALGARALDDALMRAYDAALTTYFASESVARGCFVVGTAITEAAEDPDIGRIVANGFQTLDAEFLKRIRWAQDEAEVTADRDPEALAFLATATMQSLALRARAGAPRDDLREVARKVVHVICGSLAPPPP